MKLALMRDKDLSLKTVTGSNGGEQHSSSKRHFWSDELTDKSNRRLEIILGFYFIGGFILAVIGGTWLIALGSGSTAIFLYASTKYFLSRTRTGRKLNPKILHYATILALGIFTAQFVYQVYGFFDLQMIAILATTIFTVSALWSNELKKSTVSMRRSKSDIDKLNYNLSTVNSNLEQTVDARTEKLELAVTEANAASHAKADFLATMSHEIRTPMNAIIGMTGLLMDTELEDEQRRFAETIRYSGESLLAIINDVLDFSKIESGKFEMEEHSFDLHKLVPEVFDMMSTVAMKKDIELIYYVDPELKTNVIGDSTRLRQVLINLVNNAIKFTDKGEVYLEVKKTELANSALKLNFSLRDSGIGIPKDQLTGIFDSFSQAETHTTRKYGGTGLGLAICKKIVEMMGGAISVDSEAGHGSTFTFDIVLKTGTEAASPLYREMDRKVFLDRRVLIVDDNPTNLEVLEKICQQWGFETVCSLKPVKAIEMLETDGHFDLVLLDMQMPKMDGLDWVKRARTHFTKAELPIILLSSIGIPLAAEDRAHFNMYISKPIRQLLLYDVISKTFRMRKEGHEEGKIQDPVNSPKIWNSTRVLIAEDNQVNQFVIIGMLKKLGFPNPDVVSNGIQAVEMVAENNYDLILMDMQMPEMDGITATTHIIKTLGLSNCPLIFALTANATKEDRDRCLEAGMTTFLTKPLTVKALESALLTYLRSDSDGDLDVNLVKAS